MTDSSPEAALAAILDHEPIDVGQEPRPRRSGHQAAEGLKHELGERDLPVKVLLACRALESGQSTSLSRERWTAVVASVHRYLRGEFVVEPMIRERRWQELQDFMRLLKNGPDPNLAMTDPSLFVAIRKAGTKAWMSGILHFAEPSMVPERRSDPEPETEPVPSP